MQPKKYPRILVNNKVYIVSGILIDSPPFQCIRWSGDASAKPSTMIMGCISNPPILQVKKVGPNATQKVSKNISQQ
jgi:hypothetical protein